MSEVLWRAGAVLLSFGGMAWLALSMEVHWGQVMHQPAGAAAAARQRLRAFGAAALPLALLACLAADRPSMAVLVWIMLQTGSAVAVAMVLSHRPRWLAALAAPGGAKPAPPRPQP
jgi:hypothetical protein